MSKKVVIVNEWRLATSESVRDDSIVLICKVFDSLFKSVLSLGNGSLDDVLKDKAITSEPLRLVIFKFTYLIMGHLVLRLSQRCILK